MRKVANCLNNTERNVGYCKTCNFNLFFGEKPSIFEKTFADKRSARCRLKAFAKLIVSQKKLEFIVKLNKKQLKLVMVPTLTAHPLALCSKDDLLSKKTGKQKTVSKMRRKSYWRCRCKTRNKKIVFS